MERMINVETLRFAIAEGCLPEGMWSVPVYARNPREAAEIKRLAESEYLYCVPRGSLAYYVGTHPALIDPLYWYTIQTAQHTV